MQVTNGVVEYEHPRKIADFQIPKAKVTLSFVIPEGEDPVAALAQVSQMACVQAMAMLGERAAEMALPVAEAPVDPPTRTRQSRRVAPAIPPADAMQGTAQNGAIGDTQEAGAGVGSGPTATAIASPSDPFAATAAPGTSAAPQPGALPSPASVDPRLVDKALQDACAHKVANATDKVVMTQKVKELRTKFTGDPLKGVPAIPADQRETFLAELQALV